MKGKYTNAAERRRHLDDLTERAETAERKAEKVDAELVALRATSERQIAELRGQVAELKRQRDAVTSPALDEASERINNMLRRVGELKSYEAGAAKAHQAQVGALVAALKKAGVGNDEIKQAFARAHTEITDEEINRNTFFAVVTDESFLSEAAIRLGANPREAE